MSAARAFQWVGSHRPIHVDGDPNGVAFAHGDDALYVADARSGAIARVSPGGHRRIATIDVSGSDKCRIGGIAVAPRGVVYATRLGYGGVGAVFRIDADGRARALEQLSVEPWRVGLSYDASEHSLWSAQYTKPERGAFEGSIARIDLASGDSTVVATGLRKPIGVAKLGDLLVVTDASARAVYRIDLDGDRETARTALATDIGRPDSCVAAGHDSVLVTTYDDAEGLGMVRQLWLDGTRRTIAVGEWEPRGIATDYDRVFVSVRRGARVLVFPA